MAGWILFKLGLPALAALVPLLVSLAALAWQALLVGIVVCIIILVVLIVIAYRCRARLSRLLQPLLDLAHEHGGRAFRCVLSTLAFALLTWRYEVRKRDCSVGLFAVEAVGICICSLLLVDWREAVRPDPVSFVVVSFIVVMLAVMMVPGSGATSGSGEKQKQGLMS